MSDSSKIQYENRFQYQGKTEAPSAFLKTVPLFESSKHYPWSEPVRAKIAPALAIALIASGLFAPVLNPNTQITQNFESRWHQPWSEPVRAKKGIPPYLQDINAPDVPLPPAVQSSQWFSPWSEPTRLRGLGPHQQDVAADFPQTITPATTDTRWIYPWSEPTRRTGLGTHLQDVGAPDVPNPPTVLSAQWIYPWSDPTRRTGLGVHLQDVGTPDVPNPPPAAQVISSALGSQVIYRTKFIYQSLALPPTTPAAVTDIKWLYQWSEPVRTKLGVPAHNQQTLAWSNFVTPTPSDVVVPTNWSGPPPQIRSFQYQALAQYPFPVTPVAPVSIGWFQPLSVLPKTSFTVSNATFTFLNIDNALANFWYAPWPDFAYPKKSILAAQQQSFAWGNTTPVVVTADARWVYPWSEPVRYRTFNAALQQPLAFVPLFTTASNNAAPYYPWSEPVRLKPGLKTHLQSFTSLVTPPQPNFTRTINWFQPWSYPVWPKKGLRVEYQSAFTAGTRPLATQITATMSAFEINLDQFLAGIQVTDEIPPSPPISVAGANVSIEEIPAIDGGALSIEET